MLFAGIVHGAEMPLTFGLFPYVSRGQLMDYHTPLKVYLETKLQRPVDLVTAPDFEEFMNRTQKGEYDIILAAPHMGRLAETRDGYVRIVKTGHEVQGIFLVRRDSGIRSLADLRGKSVMIAQPISVIYQMAVDHLQRNGLVPGKDITLVTTRTHNNALYAPARRESDASVTGVLLWVNAEESIRSELVAISETRSVPGFMLMANKRLSPKLVRQVQTLLLAFEKTPEGQAYFKATDLKNFSRIDDKTMKSMDPFTRILTEPVSKPQP